MKKFKRRHKLLAKENIKIDKPYELNIYRHDSPKKKERVGGIFYSEKEWQQTKGQILLFVDWWLKQKDDERSATDLDII